MEVDITEFRVYSYKLQILSGSCYNLNPNVLTITTMNGELVTDEMVEFDK